MSVNRDLRQVLKARRKTKHGRKSCGEKYGQDVKTKKSKMRRIILWETNFKISNWSKAQKKL